MLQLGHSIKFILTDISEQYQLSFRRKNGKASRSCTSDSTQTIQTSTVCFQERAIYIVSTDAAYCNVHHSWLRVHDWVSDFSQRSCEVLNLLNFSFLLKLSTIGFAFATKISNLFFTNIFNQMLSNVFLLIILLIWLSPHKNNFMRSGILLTLFKMLSLFIPI